MLWRFGVLAHCLKEGGVGNLKVRFETKYFGCETSAVSWRAQLSSPSPSEGSVLGPWKQARQIPHW